MKPEQAIEILKERGLKFRDTRSIQWKANISIWTLLILLIYHRDSVAILSESCCLKALVLTSILLVHLGFCFLVQRSLEYDKAIGDIIVENLDRNPEAIFKVSKGEIKSRQAKGLLRPTTITWFILQVGLTGILILIFCVSTNP